MKKNILDIIVCPLCKSSLSVRFESESETDIITGNLYCSVCHIYYPIDHSIANMLPPDVRYSF